MARPNVTHGAPETPTQALIKDANRIVYVTDGRGRSIGVRRLSMSVVRRLAKFLPPELSIRSDYVSQARVAGCVVSIDGANTDLFENGVMEGAMRPDIPIDALIDRLDTDGFNAVGQALLDNFRSASTKDDLKNSSPIPTEE